MNLTCLSRGSSFHFPPCHIIELWGYRILFDCPIDLSALTIFFPIPIDSAKTSSISDNRRENKRQRIEKSLEANDLICVEPWYKTVANVNLWNLCFIDIVVISSPMGILGLPYLTRNKDFSAKIYTTEVTARLGQLMMEDLVSMHLELKQFYGPTDDSCFPLWMKWEELELLPISLREKVMGGDGAELGGWQPSYSAADVKDCMQKVQTLKYAEEACYNDTLKITAFSSGLEIGASNWMINGPRMSITYLSSSIFESNHAMNFDYRSLQGSDLILFSDFSSFHGMVDFGKDTNGGSHLHACRTSITNDFSTSRDGKDNEEEFLNSLVNADESSEELDKLIFICSCAIDSVKQGGSVLIPCGRIGIVLQLLEQISLSLESSNLEVPIFMISSVAEELLAFTNIVPEWLCKQRQQNLYSGEALFGHVELIKRKKLHIFPDIHSTDFIMAWQEPCIVFSPHWSLRLGPVVHLLRRWCGDRKSLLVMEQGVDADLALLPFQPVVMKVLQCSFLSGIKLQKVRPLLEMLRPKHVLFPEDLKLQILTSNANSYSVFHYSENEKIHLPSLRNDFEVNLATDLAYQLQPRMMRQENMAIARLKGKFLLDHGKHLLVTTNEKVDTSVRQTPLHWGSLDLNVLLAALQENGINGFLGKEGSVTEANSRCVLHVYEPNKALIEIHATRTVISTDDETLASLISEVVGNVLDGI